MQELRDDTEGCAGCDGRFPIGACKRVYLRAPLRDWQGVAHDDASFCPSCLAKYNVPVPRKHRHSTSARAAWKPRHLH